MTIGEKIKETVLSILLGAAMCGGYVVISWILPVVVVNKILADSYYHNVYAYIAIGFIILNWFITGVIYVTFLGYELREIW